MLKDTPKEPFITINKRLSSIVDLTGEDRNNIEDT